MASCKPQKGTKNTKYSGRAVVLFVLLCGFTVNVSAEDGYRLWLRYEQLPSVRWTFTVSESNQLLFRDSPLHSMPFVVS